MDLRKFFKENNRVALGLSGGTDSAYLLYAAKKYCADIRAYYVKTPFQPNFELEDAKRLAKETGVELKVLYYDILRCDEIRLNPKNRCYFCKTKIFELIRKQAASDGYTTIIDGTNASDDADDRPGMRALWELKVKSPLKLCGLTKADVRRLSKEAGLFTWNKPAYACLATRVSFGNEITADRLLKIEKAEEILFNLGFTDFRIRVYYDAAKLQFKENEIEKAFNMRSEICGRLKIYFEDILLDLKGRQSYESTGN